VLTSCLNPEPAKRLTALEVLALPYFDDIHDLLKGTSLQDDYDAAYASAASDDKQSIAHSLWTACSSCTRLRNDPIATAAVHASAMSGKSGDTAKLDPGSELFPILRHSDLNDSTSDKEPVHHQGSLLPLRGIRRAESTCNARDKLHANVVRRSVTIGDSRSEEMHKVFSSFEAAGDMTRFLDSADVSGMDLKPLMTDALSAPRVTVSRQGTRVRFSEEFLVQLRASEHEGDDPIPSSVGRIQV